MSTPQQVELTPRTHAPLPHLVALLRVNPSHECTPTRPAPFGQNSPQNSSLDATPDLGSVVDSAATARMVAPAMHRPIHERAAWPAKLLNLALCGVLFLAASAPAGAQAQDEVLVEVRGNLNTVAGTVERYDLTKVTLIVGGKETTYNANQVQRVRWGDVPTEFTDGLGQLENRVYEEAVKSFRAASASASRDLVKAAAKRRTAEALMGWGAADPTRFTEAVAECEGYLSTYATNREAPFVHELHARALWLSGKPKEAGERYQAIYARMQGDKFEDGYGLEICLNAAIQGARALLDAKETLGARTIYASLTSGVGSMLAGLPAEDATRPFLQAVVDEATIGDGFVELSSGQAKQALTFFQNRVSSLSATSSATLRHCAWLGLGEAQLAEGKLREASILLAKVAALEARDSDRAARATIKLAECYSKLSDADARLQACARVKDVLANFGRTPSALRARALQKDLGC